MRSRIVLGRSLAAGCALALLISCGGPAGHGSSGSGVAPAPGEECPHDWPWTGTTEANVKAFTGNRYEVPEYNDCQRFIVGSPSAPSYSASVFAVFASDSLAEKKWSGKEQVVALVWAGDVYPQLGIKARGFHCLVMTPRTNPSTQWKAEMVPAGSDADCATRKTAAAVTLEVDEWPNMPGSSAPIPAVDLPGAVRWGFAPGPEGRVRWVQYVALPCDRGLCFVGPSGFQARPTFAVLSSMNGNLDNQGSRRRVDLWNDVQYLAAPSSSGGPKPDSPLLEGVILPDPALADRKLADYEKGWVKVAEVAVSGSGYLSKVNFAATTGGVKDYNVIYACYYDSAGGGYGNCAVDKKEETELAALTCSATSTSTGRWRTKHVNAADSTKVTYYCVDFIPFADPKLTVPGTVRWKWLANDEMTWFRCPDGCCKEIE